MCSKPSSKPLLPIHVIREKKNIKQKNGEIPQPKQPRSVRRERQEGRNSDRRGRKELRYTGRKRKALLRSREFAVAVGGAAAACWVVVVVGETKKGLRKEK